MITGSHNPSEYNGFKITIDKSPFFGSDIYALGDEIIANQDKIIPDNISKIDIDVKDTLYQLYGGAIFSPQKLSTAHSD